MVLAASGGGARLSGPPAARTKRSVPARVEASPRVTASPRVVLGMPAFARPDSLPRTLESLLSQTYDDFALVIVDDAPDATIAPIVQTYAREYSRVTYSVNVKRLGMVGNWRKVFEQARASYPAA